MKLNNMIKYLRKRNDHKNKLRNIIYAFYIMKIERCQCYLYIFFIILKLEVNNK